jgi:hypothetical protein
MSTQFSPKNKNTEENLRRGSGYIKKSNFASITPSNGKF